mmetsp:Transcript_12396/g.19136  ORF Transcript_12396/g.19136 Transcript_12396/m.19136 type:complete len:121 (+) Transcript_12396:262-624(+)
MERAMRSLTLLAGLDDSSLATISAPDSEVTLLSLTRGVCPISSRMLLAILGRASEKRVVVVVRVLVVDDGAKAVAPDARVATVRRAAESFMVYLLMCYYMVYYHVNVVCDGKDSVEQMED